MLVWRSERAPPCDCEPLSLRMPAARRLTAPRTRTADMAQNASGVVARKTNTAIRMAEWSPNISIAESSMRRASDLEIHQAIHDEVADRHPAGRAGQRHLGHVLVPHA